MTLTVRELIELLSCLNQDAHVVVGDPNDGGLGRLRAEDVREVRLRYGDANGVGWYELAEVGEASDAQGVWIF